MVCRREPCARRAVAARPHAVLEAYHSEPHAKQPPAPAPRRTELVTYAVPVRVVLLSGLSPPMSDFYTRRRDALFPWIVRAIFRSNEASCASTRGPRHAGGSHSDLGLLHLYSIGIHGRGTRTGRASFYLSLLPSPCAAGYGRTNWCRCFGLGVSALMSYLSSASGD